MNKFTPGPWHLSAGTYSQRWVVDSKSPPTGKQNLIAMLQSHWKGNENDTMDANARLIAAAPDMMELLERTIARLKQWDRDNICNDDDLYTDLINTVAEIKEKGR